MRYDRQQNGEEKLKATGEKRKEVERWRGRERDNQEKLEVTEEGEKGVSDGGNI